MRLGVFADLRYRRAGDRVSTDIAFARLLVALAERTGPLTVFGRIDPEAGVGAVELPSELIRFVELPAYPSIRRVRQATRAWTKAMPVFETWLSTLDGIWLFGPHPLSLAVARRAHRRGVPVYLGIRQHFPEYLTGRAPRGLRPVVAAIAWSLERAFHRVARYAPTVVVGEDLAQRWRASACRLLVTSFALVTTADLVAEDAAGAQPWADPVRLLSVSRLEPEKNPLLLADLLAELGSGWRMRVAGDGVLRDELARRAMRLGVDDRLDLLGNVPFGPALTRHYRECDCFVHVSFTEGVPQVLYEAMAAGCPIVATDVGGVAQALANGERGLLVRADDAARLAGALRRLAAEPELRRAIALKGREEVARQTLDQQAARLMQFFTDTAPRQARVPV